MFNNKPKNREVFFSKSSLLAFETAKKLLGFIFEEKSFTVSQAYLKFPNTPAEWQPVEIIVGFTYVLMELDWQFKFFIYKDGSSWRIVPDRPIGIHHWNEGENFKLCTRDGDSFYPCTSTDENELKDLQVRLTEMYPQSPVNGPWP